MSGCQTGWQSGRGIRSILLSLPFWVGCAQDYLLETAAIVEQQPSNCTMNADCPGEQVCDHGICSLVDAPQATISLNLVPPPNSGLLQQQLIDIGIGADRRIPDIRLEPTVTLTGTIIDPSNPLATSIPASMSLMAQHTIPGTQVKLTAPTATDGVGFSLTLVRHVSYSLSIYPENSALPPLILPDLVIGSSTRRDLRFPPSEEHLVITGRVVIEALPDNRGVGVPDVHVQAFSTDLLHLSTVALTDADGGFSITLPPGRREYHFRLSSTKANPFLPTVEVAGVHLDRSIDIGQLALGCGGIPAVSVHGYLVDENREQITSGASLSFTASVGRGTFYASAAADLTGMFEVHLLPGEYDVRVVPTPEGIDAVTLLTRTVPVEGGMLDPLVIRRKHQFRGRVLDAAGLLPVAGVSVEATLGATELSGLNRIVRVMSDLQGDFQLALDPGVFDLTFIPTPSSGFPRWVERGIEPDGAAKRFQVRAPQVVHGLVRRPDNTPLAEVQVEVYRVDAPRGSILLGSGKTDEAGQYVIVLPVEE